MVYIVKTYGSRVRFVYHYAILITSSDKSKWYVFHNSASNQPNKYSGSIQKELWSSFIKRYEPINFYPSALTEQEVLDKTKPLLNKPYNKLTFSCNTYTEIIDPKAMPIPQEDYLWFAVAILGLIAIFRHKK